MPIKIERQEIPIAYTMIETAERIKPRRDGRHPVEKFFLLWTAFNQIYTTIAAQQGRTPQLVYGADGEVETVANGSVRIPNVIPVGEEEQIALAFGEFDDRLKDGLVCHENFGFFANRKPFWQGKAIEFDANGQRVNGVVDLGRTCNREYPVWSPVDMAIYERYLLHPEDREPRDFLARQIVDLLFTISRNLRHVSASFDDGNDLSVYTHGLPLLKMIVAAFTH